MKSYRLFLWGIFIILILSGCESLEVDSPTENEVFIEMNSNLVLRSATDPNPVKGTIHVQKGENLDLKVESKNSAIKNVTWIVEESSYKGTEIFHRFKSLGKIDLQVSAEFKNGTSETRISSFDCSDVDSTGLSSSGEKLNITEFGNILDLAETSLAGKASGWYFPISKYTGAHGRISLTSLAGYPYWNAGSISGIYVYGSPSTGEMMYYDGKDFVFTSMPSCLWTENGVDIYFNSGRVGIGTTKPPLATLEASGGAQGVYGSGSNYGVKGKDTDGTGYLGYGDSGVYGYGDTYGVYGNGDFYGVYGIGLTYVLREMVTFMVLRVLVVIMIFMQMVREQTMDLLQEVMKLNYLKILLKT